MSLKEVATQSSIGIGSSSRQSKKLEHDIWKEATGSKKNGWSYGLSS